MRVLMIVNLRSGPRDAPHVDYVRALGEAGSEVTVRFLGAGGDINHLLRDASNHDCVVAAGGDGTVSAVCCALAYSGIPILAYPAGTANLLALNLGVPNLPLTLAEMTLEGNTREIDIGRIEFEDGGHEAGFVVAAGAGFDAQIMAVADKLKPTLGPGAYVAGVLQNLAPTVSRFTLDLDGRTVETEGMAILVMNVVRIQFGLSLVHESDPGDGLFEVVVVRSKYVPELIPAVWEAFIARFIPNPDRSAGIEVYTASRVRVDADPPLPLQYDGEVPSRTTPFVAQVIPRAARLVVP